MWSGIENEINASGKAIASVLIDDPNLVLLTPPKLSTYYCPRSYKKSTLDLTFASKQLSDKFEITVGPYMGSDHGPVIIETPTSHLRVTEKMIPKWNTY